MLVSEDGVKVVEQMINTWNGSQHKELRKYCEHGFSESPCPLPTLSYLSSILRYFLGKSFSEIICDENILFNKSLECEPQPQQSSSTSNRHSSIRSSQLSTSWSILSSADISLSKTRSPLVLSLKPIQQLSSHSLSSHMSSNNNNWKQKVRQMVENVTTNAKKSQNNANKNHVTSSGMGPPLKIYYESDFQ